MLRRSFFKLSAFFCCGDLTLLIVVSRLCTELAEVMVCMEVGEAHPFVVTHRAEEGMRTKAEIAWQPCEAFGQLTQPPDVGRKLCRPGSGSLLLIQFAHRLETRRPLHGRPQSSPLHDFAPDRRCRHHRCVYLAQVESTGVRQVANHLVR